MRRRKPSPMRATRMIASPAEHVAERTPARGTRRTARFERAPASCFSDAVVDAVRDERRARRAAQPAWPISTNTATTIGPRVGPQHAEQAPHHVRGFLARQRLLGDGVAPVTGAHGSVTGSVSPASVRAARRLVAARRAASTSRYSALDSSSPSWVPSATMRPSSSSTTRSASAIVAGPVGDDDRRATVHHLGERGADLVLLARVDRRGRVVEDQDARVGEHRARDRDALPLTARRASSRARR